MTDAERARLDALARETAEAIWSALCNSTERDEIPSLFEPVILAALASRVPEPPQAQEGTLGPTRIRPPFYMPQEVEEVDYTDEQCAELRADFDAFMARRASAPAGLREALEQVLAYFPTVRQIKELTPDAAMAVRGCPMMGTPKAADVLRWHAALAAPVPTSAPEVKP